MRKLKVGIIGCGGIAQKVHIPNYMKHNELVEILAVCDASDGRAQTVAEQWGIPHAYSDFREMLQHHQLDAVSVCTPNKFHAEMAIAALQAGCHVLCEKPPAVTVAEAEAMAAAAKAVNKFLTFGFHYRHAPEVDLLKRYIDSGEFGHIYAAKSQAVRRRGIPGWGVFTNKELQGGGALIDIGVHMLDTTLYLMGYPQPELVLGATYQKLGNREGVGLMGKWDWENFSVEDMARGMIVFKDGSSVTLDAAFAANVEKDEVMQVSLMGEQGGADVFPVKIYQEKHEALLDTTPAYLPQNNYYEVQFKRFIDCCLQNKPPIGTAEEAVILQKIITALYESAASGEAVRIQ
ncbi:Gfo/Idh/MocA family protein [Paenibacillus sp. GXUN7292]|uniref:Gfo/Idh/MocA family protein n=1 Tax=Paenibacillus sp. GXUN7292 TaxID=3422499 RepID=UPI003D7EFE21